MPQAIESGRDSSTSGGRAAAIRRLGLRGLDRLAGGARRFRRLAGAGRAGCAAGIVALGGRLALVAEVGHIPAGTLKRKTYGGDLPSELRLAAFGAILERVFGHALHDIEFVPAGATEIRIGWHGDLDVGGKN